MNGTNGDGGPLADVISLFPNSVENLQEWINARVAEGKTTIVCLAINPTTAEWHAHARESGPAASRMVLSWALRMYLRTIERAADRLYGL